MFSKSPCLLTVLWQRGISTFFNTTWINIVRFFVLLFSNTLKLNDCLQMPRVPVLFDCIFFFLNQGIMWCVDTWLKITPPGVDMEAQHFSYDGVLIIIIIIAIFILIVCPSIWGVLSWLVQQIPSCSMFVCIFFGTVYVLFVWGSFIILQMEWEVLLSHYRSQMNYYWCHWFSFVLVTRCIQMSK